LPLNEYAGVYNDAWYGPATIRLENAGLVFTLDHTPKAIADLQIWQYDTFKAHWRDHTIEDAFVTFSLNPLAGWITSRWLRYRHSRTSVSIIRICTLRL